MRILVDQSGYDLLNLGDVAMLQSCVLRLQMQWPNAEILVVTHNPRRLARYCPAAIPVRVAADLPLFRLLSRRPRIASEQTWKIVAPYFSLRSRRPDTLTGQPRTVIQAVHAADLIVGSGGAYITDTWWCHAAGVLSLFSLAQRLGKPTAMFGQGIGPMQLAPLRAQARTVLPKLAVLGLREGTTGRDLALSLAIAQDSIRVTGDDALELIGDADVAQGNALGISIRVSNYAGIDLAAAAAIGNVLLNMAAYLDAPIVGLPVSEHAADADVLRAVLQDEQRQTDIAVDDISSPEALISGAAKCRAIVTGSYHAAVFGLAQGVPTVCLTKFRILRR